MSRQQTRSSGDGAIDPSLVQKKRARHRLVGAICLCILAAIIVPLVLESEPRPRDGDLPIELAAAPARDADGQQAPDAKAGSTGGSEGSPAAADAAPAGAIASGAIGNLGASGRPGPGSPASPGAAPAAESQSAVRTVTPPASPPVATPPPAAVRPDAKSPADPARTDPAKADALKQAAKQEAARQEAARQEASKAAAAKADAAKADAAKADGARPPVASDKPAGRSGEPDVLARLIDRANTTGTGAASQGASGPPASRKFLVQIGAYSNVQSARSVSDKAAQVGLRPYQETVKTAQGDWIRVRVGPFSTRQDAERAQQDLKRAGVTAAIIAL